MSKTATEILLEEHIVRHLTFNDHYQVHSPDEYDRASCLLKNDLIDFLKSTQKEEYYSLARSLGSSSTAA